MCRQADSIEERRKAARGLSDACCRQGKSLRKILNETLTAPMPADIDALAEQLKHIN